MRRLWMSLDLGYPFISNSFPKNFSGLLVECVDLPGMFRVIFNRSNIAVESVASLILLVRW